MPYEHLAMEALPAYDLGEVRPVFLQHNGGIIFRLDDRAGRPRYLLKIGHMAGENGSAPPARVEAVMAWLAALARDSDVVVQAPVPSRQGSWSRLSRSLEETFPAPFSGGSRENTSAMHLRRSRRAVSA